MRHIHYKIIFVFSFLFGLNGCKTTEYTACRLESPVTIDACYSDWQGSLTSIKEGKISYGFQRDSSFFYVCLITTDMDFQRQIMMQGLEMDLDPDGEEEQRISIKYPLGIMASGMPMGGMTRSRNNFEMKRMEMAPQFQNSLNELEIKTAEDETFSRFPLSKLSSLGLEVNAKMESDKWVCEMKIPLGSSDTCPYALGQDEISFIKIRVETLEMDRDAMGGKRPDRAGGGGGPGMGGGGGGMPPGGGPPGGGGPQGGGQGFDAPDEFKASFKVILEG